MTLQRLLEKFDPLEVQPPSSQTVMLGQAEVEAMRQQTFEAGYASGWEDAKAADTDARNRIDAELERNIQNLAFTYNEAVDRVRGEVNIFISSLIETFLPDLIPDLIREHVRTELTRLADQFVEVPLEVVASPDCTDLLRDMLQSDFSMEIDLVSDSNLAEKQVFIRSQIRELEVDLVPLLTAIRAQFKAIKQTQENAINE